MALYKYRNFLTRLSSINYKNYSATATDVRIVEVGPRDGLQNETVIVPTDVKVEFINRLSETGLKTIEATSFVSAKWVPQMSDNTQVYSRINKVPSISYPVLIPNVKGLESALSVGAKEIAVFASASEGFARKNTNCTIEEGLQRIKDVVDLAKKRDLKIRGYISCIVGCPYDGYIKPSVVAKITETLLDFGCYEISLGDTIGVGTINTMKDLLKNVLTVTSPAKLAIHCHDTYGQALVNVCTALDFGIKVADSSVSGLGGCPYAKGATGNVATEDLVYLLNGLGVNTGVDLNRLIEVGQFISEALKKPTSSKVNKALYKNLKPV
ncbi:hypothetical protein ILUMI_20003 [Ignelater luminosus]|uniref:hydroxymethylglutaryl-CoA lyase n=1 Tax=Ignelater luminosus TaxID=2038154 RepID=A0A8K0FZC1_IGNLU|nr:hypothetical protein ILUMI_20003 [Ignelater luminosus]